MADNFIVGTNRRLTVDLTQGGTAVDPTSGTLVFKHRDPDGSITVKTYPTDVEVIRQTLGTFYIDVDYNLMGKWDHRWEALDSSGGTESAAEDYNIIDPGAF